MTEQKHYKDIHHELIESCRKKDRKAQIEIYKLYFHAMYNSSFRILNNRDDAEDIMQDSFLEAFNKLDRYNETGSFGAWLKKIVINKSIDFLKSKKRIDSLVDARVELKDIHQLDESDELQYNIAAQINEVKLSLEKLPEPYRLIINLYLLEGYDQREIARILGISYENVRVRYIRAKRKLMEEIANNSNLINQVSKN